jgi:glucokinase
VKVRPARPTTAPRRCGCGEVGCLEAYTSGMNIAARVREELAAGAESAIQALVQGDPARINATVVDTAHRQGDPYARALWAEVAELLGNAVASAATLLNPACLILGGGVMLGCPDLSRLVHEEIRARVTRSASMGLTLERAFLGDDAGVIGAALLD